MDYLEPTQLQPFKIRSKYATPVMTPNSAQKSEAARSFKQNKLIASRTYYMSTIHHQNRATLDRARKRTSSFIPFSDSNLTFKQRFQAHMDRLTKEEQGETVGKKVFS